MIIIIIHFHDNKGNNADMKHDNVVAENDNVINSMKGKDPDAAADVSDCLVFWQDSGVTAVSWLPVMSAMMAVRIGRSADNGDTHVSMNR